MAQRIEKNQDIANLNTQIKDTAVCLRHAKVDCEANKGEYSVIKDLQTYETIIQNLQDLKIAIAEILPALMVRKYDLGAKPIDRDSGISLGSRTSALSLRDSVPVQETGEHSQSLPLEHDEQSEATKDITCSERNMLNRSAKRVLDRRTQHERRNIFSDAIPEESSGTEKNQLSAHSSDDN